MNTNWKAIFFIGFVLTGAISCSEQLEPKPYTYSKIFTGTSKNKTWKIEYFEAVENGEILDRFPVSCVADDKYVFYNNSERTMQVHNGGNRCFIAPDAEPLIVESTWSFTNANATLTMLFPLFAGLSGLSYDTPLPFIVREVDENDLEIELFLDQDNISSYRIRFEAIDED